MANNRIYLRCKKCGAILFLGKCFTDGYYYQDYKNEGLDNALNDFYDKHTWCEASREDNKNDIKYIDTPLCDIEDVVEGNQFEIAYEFDSRKERK